MDQANTPRSLAEISADIEGHYERAQATATQVNHLHLLHLQREYNEAVMVALSVAQQVAGISEAQAAINQAQADFNAKVSSVLFVDTDNKPADPAPSGASTTAADPAASTTGTTGTTGTSGAA